MDPEASHIARALWCRGWLNGEPWTPPDRIGATYDVTWRGQLLLTTLHEIEASLPAPGSIDTSNSSTGSFDDDVSRAIVRPECATSTHRNGSKDLILPPEGFHRDGDSAGTGQTSHALIPGGHRQLYLTEIATVSTGSKRGGGGPPADPEAGHQSATRKRAKLSNPLEGKQNFSCYFVKHNGERYSQIHNSCTNPPGFTDHKELRIHTFRVHCGCLNCRKTFQNKEQLQKHREGGTCLFVPESDRKPELMDEEQERRVFSRRFDLGTTPEQKYRGLYMALWPEDPRGPSVNPYYNYLVRNPQAIQESNLYQYQGPGIYVKLREIGLAAAVEDPSAQFLSPITGTGSLPSTFSSDGMASYRETESTNITTPSRHSTPQPQLAKDQQELHDAMDNSLEVVKGSPHLDPSETDENGFFEEAMHGFGDQFLEQSSSASASQTSFE